MSTKVTKTVEKRSLRQPKHFSELVKHQTANDIEQRKCGVLEASRELCVCIQSVYLWVYKYSGYLQKNKVLIVEHKSKNYQTKVLE